ncbi:MAG TPA: amidohydrolase, partial [Terriglobales bacterium]
MIWRGILRTGLGPFLLALACLGQQPASVPTPQQAAVIEQGKFRLHKFEQAIGEEDYTIVGDGDTRLLKSDFLFRDRNTSVPLSASLRFAPDWSPLQFEVKGKNSRLTGIDDAVRVDGNTVHVRQDKIESEENRPEKFFTIAGYAPTAVQALLMRYWLTHGSPDRLKTFPAGEVRIEDRGADRVENQGQSLSLERYSISGLIWGRETVWLDAQKQLFALVSVDAEFDHFEAIRDGFEATLPALVAKAGSDQMAALAEIASKFPGRKTGKLALVGGTLVDGTGAPPVPDATVVVDGDRIVAAGPRSKVVVPKDASVIDTRGKTILPGLWDMHAHFEQVEWGPIYLAAGATTVRDVGNELEFISAVRDAIRDGRGLGPRLLLAGIVDGSGPAAIGVQRVDTAEQAQDWVNRYHQAGFQQIKIYSSMKLENVAAIAKAAHAAGMTVTGHIPIGMDAYQGVNAGMDQINHIQYIADIMRPPTVPLPEKPTRAQRMQAVAAIDLDSPEARKAVDFLKQHGTVVDDTMALMEDIFTQTAAHPPSSFEPGVNKLAPELAQQFAAPVGPPDPLESTNRAVFQKYVQIVGALHRA